VEARSEAGELRALVDPGLGLSVAYGIAIEHGGWIKAESEAGGKSSFFVYLPLEGSE
jgi:signal transduction histidine kinase